MAGAVAPKDRAKVAVRVADKAVAPVADRAVDRVAGRAAGRVADMRRDRVALLAAASPAEVKAVVVLAAIAAGRDAAEIGDLAASVERPETRPAREPVRPPRPAAGVASAVQAVSKADRLAELRAAVTVAAGRVVDSKAKAAVADAADLPAAATLIGSRCSTK